jgi:hypothetical protein
VYLMPNVIKIGHPRPGERKMKEALRYFRIRS